MVIDETILQRFVIHALGKHCEILRACQRKINEMRNAMNIIYCYRWFISQERFISQMAALYFRNIVFVL